MKRENIITYILVTLLVVLAAVLRLYRPFSLPVSYDEMGSLFRTHYNNFNDLIINNSKLDVHPVGVEVFLYFWTKLVGYNTLYVKLPFIAASVASVFYTFRIGKEWFNATTGLICAAYMATLQYSVMHGQEIRLYGIGLFFTLAMAYHWGNIIFRPEKRFDINWILYVLFSALCAYTHYFCLLTATVVGLSGVFFIKKRYVLRYITAGIMIFVLFIPHLHIFMYQLTVMKGAGGWLAKPRYTFIVEFLDYIFHFSPYVYGPAAALFLFGVLYSIIKRSFKWKPMLICFLWFFIPFAVGFIYSVKVNPVLQYRVLIFSFPFLLFTFFGMLPEINSLLKTLILTAICGANVCTLIYSRSHYNLYYTEPIKKICFLNDSLTKTLGKAGTLRFMEGDSSTGVRESFFIRNFRLDSNYLPLDNSSDKSALVDYLEENRKQILSYGCLNEADADYLPVFLNYYPRVIKKYNLFGGDFYVLSSRQEGISPVEFSSVQGFEGDNPKGWQLSDQKMTADTIHFSGMHSYKMDSLHEYGPSFSCKLKEMVGNKNDFITTEAEVYPLSNDMGKVQVVITLESGGNVICWSGESLANYIPKGEVKKWIKVYHTIKLSDVYINYADVMVKIYMWNNGKANFYMDDMAAKAIKGNPYLYGIQQALK